MLEVDRAVELDVCHVAVKERHILLMLQRSLLGEDLMYLTLDFGAGRDLVPQV